MPKIYLEGPAGKLEGMYHQAEDSKAPTALILHPNPLYGGTMNNKITYHLYKAFVNNNFSVLRINFRGVGNSSGKFDNGIGEIEDINATLDWLRIQNEKTSHYWIAGFSFGAYVGMQSIMRRPEIEGFIAVSPPCSRYNFGFFSPCPISGLVIQGSEDEISKPIETTKLVQMCHRQKSVSVSYELIEGADHFFTDYISDLDSKIDEYIKERLDNRTVKPIIKQRKRSKNKKRISTVAVKTKIRVRC
jgi:alpha/beta superfamily hydrolase